MSFNLFGPTSKKDIRLGYIDPERGYITGISILEANQFGFKNPGTIFILETRDSIRYLTINEVNKLNSIDILPSRNSAQNTCENITGLKPGASVSTERNPIIVISGSGGVGAKASPVIGRDGSLLDIAISDGGFGYTSPPKVRVLDPNRRATGAVAVSVIGVSTVSTVEYYDQEEDFEEYNFDPDNGPASISGYGSRFDVNGNVIGGWDPTLYANFANDPIKIEIQRYQEFLKQGIKPFWHTRKENPLSVTFNDKTSRVVNNVTHPAWDDGFMNKYAVSPVPNSNVPGSDYAGRVATMVWEENFPYTGEYTFRSMGDNVSTVYFDNDKIFSTTNFKGGVKDILKKTVQEGVHRIKIDLYNIPIKEKVIVKAPKGDSTNIKFRVTTSAKFANGIKIPGLGINVGKQYDGKQLNESFNRDINYGIEYDVTTTSGGKGKIRLRTSGQNVLQMEETDDNDWKDLVCTVSGGRFIKINGNKCKLIFDAPPSTKNESQTSQVSGSIFNTIDYINKASRKLWRTNVYTKGGFINNYGVCPFPTRKTLDNNPYDGDHIILWTNVNFPANGNYKIEVAADDSVKLFIGNKSGGGDAGIGNGLRSVDEGGDEVIIEKQGFAPGTSKGTGKSTYIKYFKKGKYRIRAELYQKPGGRFGFNPNSNSAETSPISASFVREGNNIFLKVDGSGTANINFTLRVDDNNITSGLALSGLKIGLPPNDYIHMSRSRSGSGYKEKEVITGSDTFEAGRKYQVFIEGKSSTAGQRIVGNGSEVQFDDNAVNGFDENASLKISRIDNLQPSSVKGINPMALAINITSDSVEETKISPRTFNQNPMGSAVTIEASLPPIPQEPIVRGEGRCPENPMWTTRFSGGSQKWWPVTHRRERDGARSWSKFMNRYAISPVPPLGSPNSDGGGIVYTNTWNIEIPYSGFYALKGAVDNGGRILVDGVVKIQGGYFSSTVSAGNVQSLAGWNAVSPPLTKFFLEKGSHTITAEVENNKSSTSRIVERKIFSTKDWAGKKIKNPAEPAERCEATIIYHGLHPRNKQLKVSSDKKRIDFSDADGKFNDSSFTIKSGDAVFSDDGKKLIGEKATLEFKYYDNRVTDGEAITSISIGKINWNKKQHPGSLYKTAKEAYDAGDISGLSDFSKDIITETRWRSNESLLVAPGLYKQSRGVFDRVRDNGTSIWQVDADDPDQGTVPLGRPNVADSGKETKVINICVESGKEFKSAKPTSTSIQAAQSQNGITYLGPALFKHNQKVWSKFMNMNNVSPFLGVPFDKLDPNLPGDRTYIWTDVPFPETGRYKFLFQSDDTAKLFINGTLIRDSKSFRGDPRITYAEIASGKYEVKIVCNNLDFKERNRFQNNPTGFALKIMREITITTESKSWTKNPVGISAILIPPPCPKVIVGKGVVEDIIVKQPGNGYVLPPGLGTSSIVTVKDIFIDSPGINYDPKDKLLINGNPVDISVDGFGRVVSVKVPRNTGIGIPPIIITRYPDIQLPSLTGVGFRGTPINETIIVPEDVFDPEQLIQVTDLVGLKQTGYVNGKPYYGSVFSKDGQLFAGISETIGKIIPVYATLQESIDAEITTIPSAILRQGTDISSNDPRLNIPGTPNNLV